MQNVSREANAVRIAREKFFRLKTAREDFGYLPEISLLAAVPQVALSSIAIGGRRFARYGYEQVRGARSGV